jgi:hypothetical protein
VDLTDTERAVRTLLDIEAIKILKAQYFRFLDTQCWDDWRELFTDDLRFESEYTNTQLRDRETFVARFMEARKGGRSVHHGHMGEVQITGDETATGIWAFDDFVEEAPFDRRRVAFRGSGHYFEQYVKRDGRWLISSITLVRLRVDSLDTWSTHLA